MVGELIHTLETTDSTMKEEMVVKIAILAEKFSNDNLKWYVDVMVQVVLLAGDYVAEAVWHRIVLIVTNHDDIHEYAAEKLFSAVRNKWTHDTAIALAAYLLGEVGFNICAKPGMSGYDQFAALHQHFPLCNAKVQGILLTCYIKLLNLYPDTSEFIVDVFNKYSTSSILELQQRSCEYLALPSISADVREQVLNPMPAYSIEKESSLLALTEGSKTSPEKVKSTQSESPAVSRGQVLSIQKPEEKTLDLLALDDDDSDDLEEKGIPSDVTPKLLGWLNNALIAAPRYYHCIIIIVIIHYYYF
jgi:AP-2 complex subunit alpha